MPAELRFRGGLAVIDNSRINNALTAWVNAADGRTVVPNEEDGLFTCTLFGSGKPIVGRSKLGAIDAAAQALGQADALDYEQRYGTEQYQELSRVLVEMNELARAV